MSCLRARVEEAGGDLRWNTELTGFETTARGIKRARIPDGEIAADEFVLCAGSWSPGIARQLGLKLPVQAGKGYSLTLPKPRRLPRIPSILTEARVAVTPMGQSLRFGGTMEIAGINSRISPRRVQQIIRSVPSYFPEFSAEISRVSSPWCGLRPCSPDGLPYIGRSRAQENLTSPRVMR